MDGVRFCNPFDAALAEEGPPSVFLLDREGMLRFDDSWTRDAWAALGPPQRPDIDQPERLERLAPRRGAPSWRLLRDRATGYVVPVMVNSPDLLLSHARADVRLYPDREAALGAAAAFGHPPLCPEAW